MSTHPGFPFCSDSAQKGRKSPASPVGVRPRQGTGNTMDSTHPVQSCKGQAGEGSWVEKRVGILWKCNRDIKMCRQCGRGSPGYKEKQRAGVGAWKHGSLTTLGWEAVWGSCPGRAPEGMLVPKRFFGRHTPSVFLSCAPHLPGHSHERHHFWGSAGRRH